MAGDSATRVDSSLAGHSWPGTEPAAGHDGTPSQPGPNSRPADRPAPAGRPLAAEACDDGAVSDPREPIRRPTRRPAPLRDPLVGVERLLLDGNNLLHALSAGASPAPQATLIGRLRAIVPAEVRIEIVFDGPPDLGLHGARLAHGLTVRYSGRLTADAMLLKLVAEATGGIPDPSGSPAILVVTDDGRLAHDLRTRGAGTIGTSWVVRRLDRARLSAPSVGRPRPPAGSGIGGTRLLAGTSVDPGRAASRDADAARSGWQPGRGATAKRGNPKRGHPAS